MHLFVAERRATKLLSLVVGGLPTEPRDRSQVSNRVRASGDPGSDAGAESGDPHTTGAQRRYLISGCKNC